MITNLQISWSFKRVLCKYLSRMSGAVSLFSDWYNDTAMTITLNLSTIIKLRKCRELCILQYNVTSVVILLIEPYRITKSFVYHARQYTFTPFIDCKWGSFQGNLHYVVTTATISNTSSAYICI